MQDEFLRLQGALKKTIMFVTHDFDEALRLADRIAIMKDGIIEQLDTPANIVLSPATEYVRKFTEEVPREKVLKIVSVMEPMSDNKNLSDLKVSKDAIIETVAEKILSQEKPVAVIDSNKKIIGIVKPSKSYSHCIWWKKRKFIIYGNFKKIPKNIPVVFFINYFLWLMFCNRCSRRL